MNKNEHKQKEGKNTMENPAARTLRTETARAKCQSLEKSQPLLLLFAIQLSSGQPRCRCRC